MWTPEKFLVSSGYLVTKTYLQPASTLFNLRTSTRTWMDVSNNNNIRIRVELHFVDNPALNACHGRLFGLLVSNRARTTRSFVSSPLFCSLFKSKLAYYRWFWGNFNYSCCHFSWRQPIISACSAQTITCIAQYMRILSTFLCSFQCLGTWHMLWNVVWFAAKAAAFRMEAFACISGSPRGIVFVLQTSENFVELIVMRTVDIVSQLRIISWIKTSHNGVLRYFAYLVKKCSDYILLIEKRVWRVGIS